MGSIYGNSLSSMDQPRRNMTDNLYRDYQRRNEKLKCKQKGILKTVVENISIGLTANPINNGKKWVKRTLGKAGLIPKVFHVELAIRYALHKVVLANTLIIRSLVLFTIFLS